MNLYPHPVLPERPHRPRLELCGERSSCHSMPLVESLYADKVSRKLHEGSAKEELRS
jgi:hypothetical protein